MIVICAILCVSVPGNVYRNLIPINSQYGKDPSLDLKTQNPSFFNYIDFEKDKVYLIIQHTQGMEYWQIKYFANPVQTNPNFSWSIGMNDEEDFIWTMKINANEWERILYEENYDYVYLMQINDVFLKEFSRLFEKPSDIVEKGVYKVVKTNDKRVKLQYVQS